MAGMRIHITADYLKNINIEGNVIPLHWFQIIGEVNRYGQFKANLLAVNIMAEIVYWYRPVTERNQQTGFYDIIRMKFSGDKYQFSYRHIKVKFGASKKAAKAACDLLVKLEAIDREFRHETIKGIKYGNVMHIEPRLEWLKANTIPPKTDTGVAAKKVASSRPKSGHRTTQKGGTNTESTTETSTEINKNAAREALPLVNDILKMIYDGTDNKQSLFTDHRIRKLVEKAIEFDGVEVLKASLAEYLSDSWLKEKRAYNFTKFFNEKAVREKYKPRAAVKVVQKADVHWLDSTEYTDDKKTEILTKGILQGNILPARWIEWEDKICKLLAQKGYSTSEILTKYREKEASARTAKTPNAQMAS